MSSKIKVLRLASELLGIVFISSLITALASLYIAIWSDNLALALRILGTSALTFAIALTLGLSCHKAYTELENEK